MHCFSLLKTKTVVAGPVSLVCGGGRKSTSRTLWVRELDVVGLPVTARRGAALHAHRGGARGAFGDGDLRKNGVGAGCRAVVGRHPEYGAVACCEAIALGPRVEVAH